MVRPRGLHPIVSWHMRGKCEREKRSASRREEEERRERERDGGRESEGGISRTPESGSGDEGVGGVDSGYRCGCYVFS